MAAEDDMNEQNYPKTEDYVAAEEAVEMAATQPESGGIVDAVLGTIALIFSYVAYMAEAVPAPFPLNYLAVGFGLAFVAVVSFYIGIFIVIGLLFLALLGFFGLGGLSFLGL